MQIDKKYLNLIYKKYRNTVSSKEEHELSAWLKSNPLHQQQFKEMNKIFAEGEQIELPSIPNKDALWNRIKKETINKTDQQVSLLEKRHKVIMPIRSRILVYAACILVLIIIGFGLKNLFWNRYYFTSTKNGERSIIELVDGSSIQLNSATRVKYSKSYPHENRIIYLSGEAYFKVVQSNLPFIVFTNNAQTTVMGTEFNIWSRDQDTRITVKKGKVEFKSTVVDTLPVILVKGQMSVVMGEKAPQHPRDVDTTHVASWLQNKLVFEKISLEGVARELERFYDVHIQISDSDLKRRTITATIHQLSIDEAVQSICGALDIEYVKKLDLFILRPKGKMK